MLWGNNKKEIEELQNVSLSLIKKVDKALSDICQLQHNQELLKTNQNSLRGLVNRKIGGAQPILEEPKEETENDTNKNPQIFLNPDGKPI